MNAVLLLLAIWCLSGVLVVLLYNLAKLAYGGNDGS